MSNEKLKQTEIGKIPEDWEESKLGDKIIHRKGFAFKSKDFQKEGCPIIRVSNFTDRSINLDNCDKLNFEKARNHEDVQLFTNDVVIATVGSWPSNPASIVGKVIRASEEANKSLLNQNAVIIRPKNNQLDNNFLFYRLRNFDFSDHLIGGAQGSANQASITLNSIFDFGFLKPPLPEQLSIASILSSLDTKIELNNKMNKTLEAIGQALFKKWFIDNPEKEGWAASTIGDKLKTVLGGTPSRTKPEYWNGNINWINSGKVNEFRIIEPSERITEKGLNKSATTLLPKGTTVLAITGATLGQVSLLEIDTCANQSVIGVLENEKFSSEFIYYLIKEKIQSIISHQTGGAQQHINKTNVDNFEFKIPDKIVLEKFNQVTKPLFKQITTNCFQSQTLSQIRDSLLPKLMSGKIRVR